MFGTILAVVKTGIKVVTLVGEVIDHFEREHAAEQAKKAREGAIIGEAYRQASNAAGHEAKKSTK